ncbi:MAG: DegT/DnrJ/EryC1/StrS family aminotransferase [Gemmatimonadetes bacterium]|nr:DegT/DnrJ/EryC1/StrS family aminotransferase [Gemmatimonadota bacterium]
MPGFELIGVEERAAVNELFDDGGILYRYGFANERNERYRVLEFERAFAGYMGVEHALAVTSGTAALKVGLRALGVGPGDEVITQAFTFVATVEAIADVGAKPVVVNIDDTLNMDPVQLESAITEGTRAIIPVHMLGVAAEMDAVMEVANRYGVPVLEDTCEGLGALWNGKKLGTHGAASAFSFDFGKVITTGEGGMLTTNDEEIDKLAREYHDHGHENDPSVPRGRDGRRIFGFNYRMNEIQAAIGLAQLEKLDFIVETNRRHYRVLEAGLRDLPGLRFRRIPEACTPLCDALVFELPSEEAAGAFAQRMAEQGIGVKNLPDAMTWHFAGDWDHIFRHFGMSDAELRRVTRSSRERLSRCIAVPIMVKYTPEEVEEIVHTLREIATEVSEPISQR